MTETSKKHRKTQHKTDVYEQLESTIFTHETEINFQVPP